MRIVIFLILFFAFQPLTFAMERVFYVLHDQQKEALETLKVHNNRVDIVIPQAYVIDKNGTVSGEVSPEIIAFCKENHIRVLPMVTNSNFDPKVTHAFLDNPVAQKKALDDLLQKAKKNQFIGLQFDFEMIPLQDKTLLTNFYTLASTTFRQNNLIISFAIAPTRADENFETAYQKKQYQVWQGAYDLKKIAELSDFVTIMSYDQHGMGTIPGPIASTPWVNDVIKHILTSIPANKVSLGIPTYSGLWYMSEVPRTTRIGVNYDTVDYKTLHYILGKYKPRVVWDDINNINYAFYDAAGTNKYLFIEDAESFEAKKDLAKKYNLRGISVFRVGIEDPKIWEVL